MPDDGGEVRMDARASDAHVDAPPGPTDAGSGRCPETDDDTIALWDFESGLPTSMVDVAGGHDGTIASGAMGTPSVGGCGTALLFGGSDPPAHVEVPDSPEFDLSVGSLDFWLRFDGEITNNDAPMRGIISRDAMFTETDGHLAVMLTGDGTIVARIQTGSPHIYQCSERIARGTWTHVGIVFGPPVAGLYVDGRRATRTDTITVPLLGDLQCGTNGSAGIAGNDNPFVFGAGAWSSAEGSATPLDGYLAPAAIDHVRLSSVRRDFTR